jgi:hypothetical protein
VKLNNHLHSVPRLSRREAIPPLTQCVLIAWCVVNHRDVTFTLFITVVTLSQLRIIRNMFITIYQSARIRYIKLTKLNINQQQNLQHCLFRARINSEKTNIFRHAVESLAEPHRISGHLRRARTRIHRAGFETMIPVSGWSHRSSAAFL